MGLRSKQFLYGVYQPVGHVREEHALQILYWVM